MKDANETDRAATHRRDGAGDWPNKQAEIVTTQEVWMSGQNFPALEYLWLSGNKLNSLKFNSNQVPKLKQLYLVGNLDYRATISAAHGLQRIDITNATALTLLDVGGNNARSLSTIVTPSSRCASASLTCRW